MLQYIKVITIYLIMKNYFNKLSQQCSLIYKLSRKKILVQIAPGARDLSPILNLDIKS